MFDLTRPERELFLRLSGLTNGAAVIYLMTNPVPADQIWMPTFMCVENLSSETINIWFSVQLPSDLRHLGVMVSATATNAAATNVLPLVGPGDKVGATLQGSSASGIVWLTLTGWIFHERKEPYIPQNLGGTP